MLIPSLSLIHTTFNAFIEHIKLTFSTYVILCFLCTASSIHIVFYGFIIITICVTFTKLILFALA